MDSEELIVRTEYGPDPQPGPGPGSEDESNQVTTSPFYYFYQPHIINNPISVLAIFIGLILACCALGFGLLSSGSDPPPDPGQPTGEALLLFGGYGGYTSGPQKEVYRLNATVLSDPHANGSAVWKQCKSLSLARENPRAVVFNGSVYLTGGLFINWTQGGTEVYLKTFEKYNPVEDSWSPPLLDMINARTEHCAVLFEGPANQSTLYVIGGRNSSYPATFVERYKFNSLNPKWESRAPSLVPLRDHQCVTFGDGILVFGGMSEEPHGLLYTPGTDSWTTLSVCQLYCTSFALVRGLLSSRLYAIGGQPDPATVRYLDLTNSTNGSSICSLPWIAGPHSSDLGMGRWWSDAVVVKSRGTIVVAGGTHQNGSDSYYVTDTMEEFRPDPERGGGGRVGSWRPLPITLPRVLDRFTLVSYQFP